MHRLLIVLLFTISVFADTREASLARAIAHVEGFYTRGTLVQRLHNPGALIFIGQAQATRHKTGYALFPTDQAGWDALLSDLAGKFARGWTQAQILRRWSMMPDTYPQAIQKFSNP